MVDDKVKRNSDVLYNQIVRLIRKNIKYRDMEYMFKLFTFLYPSLMASSIDALIVDSEFEKKMNLADEFSHITKMLLSERERSRSIENKTNH